MAKVYLQRTDKHIEVAVGDDLLRALLAAGHPISTSCGGRASCGLCRVRVVRGGELLSPLGEDEVQHLGSVAKVIGTRLACQSRVVTDGELEVDVPDVDDVELRKRLKAERAQRERFQQRPDGNRNTPRAATTKTAEPRVEWRPRKLAGPGSQGQK